MSATPCPFESAGRPFESGQARSLSFRPGFPEFLVWLLSGFHPPISP